VYFQQDGSQGEPVIGVVKLITHEVDDKTRRVHVHVHIHNEDGYLLIHSLGTGRIVVRKVPQAVAVPESAVQLRGHCQVVFVRMGPDRIEARRVEVGVSGDGYTQIATGVSPGDEVVTGGGKALMEQVVRNTPTVDQ
jgi:multidrug efflux pump subunit AcrA (membrane-fusion protein)